MQTPSPLGTERAFERAPARVFPKPARPVEAGFCSLPQTPLRSPGVCPSRRGAPARGQRRPPSPLLPQSFAQAEPEAVRRQLLVNFVAPILLTRQALPLLLARGGMVINVGTALGNIAVPDLGAYGATKAGLTYWNDALRRELRHRGVRVCLLVEPGPVKTEFFEAIEANPPDAGRSPSLRRRLALSRPRLTMWSGGLPAC